MESNEQKQPDRISQQIYESRYVSRDLSWIQFNFRVLWQAARRNLNVFERLKFVAITASNLDEFFMIRVGSLYNYIDYQKTRTDYSGLRENEFRIKLLAECQAFFQKQSEVYRQLVARAGKYKFGIVGVDFLTEEERKATKAYFEKTIFPTLTPMVTDVFHTFPVLRNLNLVLGVVTADTHEERDKRKASFLQIPSNLPRFFEIERDGRILFVPIESIIRENIGYCFRNVKILHVNVFRVTRNGDYTLEESEDLETDFMDEIKRKLKAVGRDGW